MGLPPPQGGNPLQLKLGAGSARRQVQSQHCPHWHGPGKRSLGTDAVHLVPGAQDGFVGPRRAAVRPPPVHAVSARPELVKTNGAIIPPLTATSSIYTT